jgi:hypothetical protein
MGFADRQRERGFADLARPKQGDGGRAIDSFEQPVLDMAINHPCNSG